MCLSDELGAHDWFVVGNDEFAHAEYKPVPYLPTVLLLRCIVSL